MPIEPLADELRALHSSNVQAGSVAAQAGSVSHSALQQVTSPPVPRHSRAQIKARALAAIAEHIQVYGRKHWDLVRERPEFEAVIGKAAGQNGKRTFYRWVEAVSKPMPPDTTRPHEGRAVADQALATATERARLAAQQNLPAAPSPAYMMGAGAQATKNIDFLAEIDRMWDDILRLRSQSIDAGDGSPGSEVITDPKAFDRTISRRAEVMQTAVRVMQEIWDLQEHQRLYEAITSIIVEDLASVPEIQQRVVAKIAELNKTRGMTSFGGER
jgi:hypothetical protein